MIVHVVYSFRRLFNKAKHILQGDWLFVVLDFAFFSVLGIVVSQFAVVVI